ncbi:btb/poz domain-containing protein [Anaeramoeba flamelloides]|uniref:Btb/poz domain-containing protein n=1 Tax=Anaeramoeba flamelloides TaxID=1746091 RepID=A0AAV7Y2Q7_9EUKA|nr:btb/poz domain-containing protein [Anaeramoeba flamelloides]
MILTIQEVLSKLFNDFQTSNVLFHFPKTSENIWSHKLILSTLSTFWRNKFYPMGWKGTDHLAFLSKTKSKKKKTPKTKSNKQQEQQPEQNPKTQIQKHSHQFRSLNKRSLSSQMDFNNYYQELEQKQKFKQKNKNKKKKNKNNYKNKNKNKKLKNKNKSLSQTNLKHHYSFHHEIKKNTNNKKGDQKKRNLPQSNYNNRDTMNNNGNESVNKYRQYDPFSKNKQYNNRFYSLNEFYNESNSINQMNQKISFQKNKRQEFNGQEKNQEQDQEKYQKRGQEKDQGKHQEIDHNKPIIIFQIDNFDYQCFENIIKFAYTKEVPELTESNIFEYYKICVEYQMNELEPIFLKYLSSLVTVDNCVSMFLKIDNEKFHKFLIRFIKKNLQSFFQNPKRLVGCTEEIILKILKIKLNVEKKNISINIFRNVYEWGKFQIDKNKTNNNNDNDNSNDNFNGNDNDNDNGINININNNNIIEIYDEENLSKILVNILPLIRLDLMNSEELNEISLTGLFEPDKFFQNIFNDNTETKNNNKDASNEKGNQEKKNSNLYNSNHNKNVHHSKSKTKTRRSKISKFSQKKGIKRKKKKDSLQKKKKGNSSSKKTRNLYKKKYKPKTKKTNQTVPYDNKGNEIMNSPISPFEMDKKSHQLNNYNDPKSLDYQIEQPQFGTDMDETENFSQSGFNLENDSNDDNPVPNFEISFSTDSDSDSDSNTNFNSDNNSESYSYTNSNSNLTSTSFSNITTTNSYNNNTNTNTTTTTTTNTNTNTNTNNNTNTNTSSSSYSNSNSNFHSNEDLIIEKEKTNSNKKTNKKANKKTNKNYAIEQIKQLELQEQKINKIAGYKLGSKEFGKRKEENNVKEKEKQKQKQNLNEKNNINEKRNTNENQKKLKMKKCYSVDDPTNNEKFEQNNLNNTPKTIKTVPYNYNYTNNNNNNNNNNDNTNTNNNSRRGIENNNEKKNTYQNKNNTRKNKHKHRNQNKNKNKNKNQPRQNQNKHYKNNINITNNNNKKNKKANKHSNYNSNKNYKSNKNYNNKKTNQKKRRYSQGNNKNCRVLLICADNDENHIQDLKDSLNNPNIKTIDTIVVTSKIPSLSYLKKYSVLLVYSLDKFHNSSLLGDRLASFVDSGGGIVISAYPSLLLENGDLTSTSTNNETEKENSNENFFKSEFLGGRITEKSFLPVAKGKLLKASHLKMGNKNFPNHPILKNVHDFNGGNSSLHCNLSLSTDGNSQIISEWEDSTPLIAIKKKNPKAGYVVVLNFCPLSSNVGTSNFWLHSTDGNVILCNSIIFASKKV